MRIGHGYDVHRLIPGRKLILCGTAIPFDLGLDGHSDADVAAHAVMDALLGAASLGDIGKLFPDTDDRFLGADSLKLLRHVAALIAENGYSISNVDVTIVAQRPKLSGFTGEMVNKLASAMSLRPGQVSVKATTEEGLGFTGEGKAIAAHAVTLIE